MTIKEFETLVTNKHSIAGLVSLHIGGRPITNRFATVDEVLKKQAAASGKQAVLEVRGDKRFSVAVGGIAMAARASSTSGAAALAQGGYAAGGQIFQDGKVLGGKAMGGDGEGDYGRGGLGWGGNAFAPDSKSAKGIRAGTGTGGKFVKALKNNNSSLFNFLS